ncbi:MAG: HU family DNA-binding protein [Burkholderiaceae bacterium]|nr:HU family DNA-binding protein [Burkholderiaceae bacterium]
MATAKKTGAKAAVAQKTVVAKPAAKKVAAKKAVAQKVVAKKAVAVAAKVASKVATKVAAKTAAPAPLKPVITGALKPIKAAFSKTGLIAHLATTAAVDAKAVKAVVVALEATIAASIAKKGLGSFTLPGLLKISAEHVPAKKARTGIDPFTKQERKFAAKPATTKVKVRAMKKLKDAALA